MFRSFHSIIVLNEVRQ